MGMGARAKRTKRIMESSLGDFVAECMAGEESREDFRRNWSGGFGFRNAPGGVRYVTTPLSTYRDAEPREESNWSVITREMDKADSFSHISEHPGAQTHTEGSCLYGWSESMMVRLDDAVALKAARDICNALADYPVLDEEDCSEREWNANHPDDGHTCYAEACDCAQGQHDRMNEEEEHSGCRAWLYGELEAQPDKDDAGWRTFDGGDVEEFHHEVEPLATLGDMREALDLSGPEPDMDDAREFALWSPKTGALVSWQWWCGHDGCGHWIGANVKDLRTIRRHRLFSDLPPRPTVSLVKETQGRLF